MLKIPGLYVAPSDGKDRGVFTAIDLHPGDVVEICPVIVIPPEEVQFIDKTLLYNYYFLWPDPEGSGCIPLGLGSIYNHGDNCNAEVELDVPDRSFRVICSKAIKAGHEILIDYTGGGKGKLWFEKE